MAEERTETPRSTSVVNTNVVPLRPRRELPREPLVRDGVGRVLRRLRRDQGRTLGDVSSEARVSMPYLSEIERGRKEASSEVLSAVCDALEIRPSTLMILTGRELAGVSAPHRVSRGPAPVTMMAA